MTTHRVFWQFGMSSADWNGPAHIEVQGARRLPGEWFPCEAPEKPWDDDVALHDCCRACLIGARASLQRGDDYDPTGLDELVEFMAERLDRFGEAPRLDR